MGLHTKKQKNLLPTDDPETVGDHWDINGIDPQSKLLITFVPGRRTEENIKAAIEDAASRLKKENRPPALFTDGEPAYQNAIVETFGKTYQPPRKSLVGRPPKLIRRVPHDLVYAQIIKHREKERVIKVEIRKIFGKGKVDEVVKKLGWNAPNTSAIERYNLTDRMRNRRKHLRPN